MSNDLSSRCFAQSHEWAYKISDSTVEVGISNHAQESLGDVVYVELPEVGSQVSAGEECCSVESVKAASDIYAPVSGEIIEINEALDDEPELLNESPYGDGWMFRIQISDASELDNLMNEDEYLAQLDD